MADELRDRFPGSSAFDQIMDLEGEVYRAKEGRRTLMFEHQGREYFAKIHRGIGWREIWKNLSQLKWPIITASNEWKAVALLERSGVETVKIVGKGVRGLNPAKVQSFVVMQALDERIELEDFFKEMGGTGGPRRLALKRMLLRKVADSARRMHAAGMNHRDFYLCHFHIQNRDWSHWRPGDEVRLPLLDLHRAQIRSKVPRRWLVKDLGALLFSAVDCGFTDRDMAAFLKIYIGPNWKDQLRSNAGLWRSVLIRAGKFYQRHRGKAMVLPGIFAHLR
ncbi:lipopolysaccharide core heptose(I) kinase RfaP [Verrucomicrobiaceae bacterium N1E253]|uniref:Lipopolysaccharide core heptose(I) kinase RfaP n=1 Tax=Oceaniferula marina TaxID=2748318 RepID=A0A851GRI5_9BACT|nr:lipopolysaccharide core heptose(I) kinase RfaP [Oceaniferula marina]